MKVNLFTDGGSRGNPGPAAAGVVVLDSDNEVVNTANRYLGEATNNQAEYRALILGLELVKKTYPHHSTQDISLNVYMDSELIVRHMLGEYKVRAIELLPLFTEAKTLAGQFGTIDFIHVPREKNAQADALVNQCLDRQGR